MYFYLYTYFLCIPELKNVDFSIKMVITDLKELKIVKYIFVLAAILKKTQIFHIWGWIELVSLDIFSPMDLRYIIAKGNICIMIWSKHPILCS